MKTEMFTDATADHGDAVVTFMEQMIPHHLNAVAMSKALMKSVRGS